MERVTPLWQPNEKECLVAILEILIDESLLATRRKLGYSDVSPIDSNFWTNIGLDFDRLRQSPEPMRMISDFLPYFWIPDEGLQSFLTLPGTSFNAVIKELVRELEPTWHDDGKIVLADSMTPELARFIQTHRPRIQRIITLLGPSLQHVCTTWQVKPDQYKALICRDTLELLDPQVRWNMLYGSRIL